MKKVLAVLFGVLATTGALAETLVGQVFAKDSSRKNHLFNYKNITTELEGMQKQEAQFVDLNGQILVIETAERQGTKPKTYTMDHRQTGRKGSIVVDGQKVIFNYEENGKKKGPEEEDLKENFVVGPTLVPYISSHWKELMDGKSVDIRFGVWDRQETVGFSLSKVGQEKLDGKDVVLLKFKPTSFVIAALVDPLIFKVSTDGKDLLSLIGRVMPKRKDGNKWKDLDAEVMYKKEN